MNLKDNPFYILGVSPFADRAAIMDVAEEMSLLQDSDASTEAQSILINPKKRLEAELGWFLDQQFEAETLKSVIDAPKCIDLQGFSSLSRFNFSVYNCVQSNVDGTLQISDSIIEIDALYAALDVDDIVQLINNCRSVARFPEVQRQDVAQSLNERRDEVERTLTDKLSSLSQDEYVEIITRVAEELVKPYRGAEGTIISGLIDQYEVHIQSELESRTHLVEQQIEWVQQQSDERTVELGVRDLITVTLQWDKIAQPIQLKSQASGMPHGNSEHLGSELRGLILCLNNEKYMPELALTLAEALKSVFAELEEFAGLFKNDSEDLQSLIKSSKVAATLAEKIDDMLKIGDSVVKNPKKQSVINFANQVIEVNKQVKDSDLSNSEKIKIREMLYYAARIVAVTIHNEKNQTDYAFEIITKVAPEFSDLWNLKSKIEEDKSILMRELSAKKAAQSSHSNSSGYGCLILGFFLFLYIVVASCAAS